MDQVISEKIKRFYGSGPSSNETATLPFWALDKHFVHDLRPEEAIYATINRKNPVKWNTVLQLPVYGDNLGLVIDFIEGEKIIISTVPFEALMVEMDNNKGGRVVSVHYGVIYPIFQRGGHFSASLTLTYTQARYQHEMGLTFHWKMIMGDPKKSDDKKRHKNNKSIQKRQSNKIKQHETAKKTTGVQKKKSESFTILDFITTKKIT